MTAQLPPPGDDIAAIRAQLAGIADQLAALEQRQPRVIVAGVRIGFIAWVDLLVKIALASIPAMIIVGAVFVFLFALLSVFGIGLLR